MDKTIIIANWKMNPTSAQEAQELFGAVAKGVEKTEGVGVIVCPPFPYIPELTHAAFSTVLGVGGQDCFWEEEGAYTGEVSAKMLKNIGCTHVILGHSERAKYLGETQEMVQKKAQAALAAGLKIILCVGENEETPNDMENLVVVYEPEWAISTEGGKAADTKLVGEKIASMRQTLKNAPILYGGSVSSANISSFIKETGVQGALVGSSSLDANEFIQLVRNARKQ